MTLEELWKLPRDITKMARMVSKPDKYISMGYKTPKDAFNAAFYKSGYEHEDYLADDWYSCDS